LKPKIYSDFGWDAPIVHVGCNLCVRLVKWCNPSPVPRVLSSIYCTSVHKLALTN